MEIEASGSVAPAVRLPFALDAASGEIRWARERRRGERCVCVGCGVPVVLRAGEVRRVHYAHATEAPCSAETALHRGTIAILAAAIEDASARRRPLLAPSACRDCDLVAERDLARLPGLRALSERTIGAGGARARPDLLVVRGPRPRAVYAVEVVVTHAPEDEARAVWARCGLPCVIVRPSWEAVAALELPLRSLRALGEVAIEGARCTSWRHPPARGVPCERCGREGVVCTLQRWSGVACWRCGERVPHADVRLHDDDADVGDGWDGQPLASARTLGTAILPLARALGVALDERWTYRAGRDEIVHACPECGTAQPRAARGGDREPERVLAASWCARCRTLAPLAAPRTRA